ncbi:MAG: alkaline shock response membrane anchor protein AmaP [Leptotrichiaceae bacterium]|jgi:hypothetical protein|nr:alkaline shock response membrane anchor protein AmaP [Leptotrichiaceae bacterium]
MTAILSLLTRISIILGVIGAFFLSLSDIIMKTDYLNQIDNYLDFSSLKAQIIVLLIATLYLVLFLLSFVHRVTKYSQNKRIKSKNNEIEVTVKTINEVSKEFLMNQELIKNAKVKSFQKSKSVVIEAVVDAHGTENLSEKILEIQEKLSEHVFTTTGIQVKSTKIRLKKILNNDIVEKNITNTNIPETLVKEETI